MQFRKRLKKKGLDIRRLDETSLRPIFAFYRDKRISREGVYALMEKSARGEALPQAGEVLPAAETEVYAQVASSSAALRGLEIHNPDRRAHVLMGLVMSALRGRVEGAAVVERVRAAAEEKC